MRSAGAASSYRTLLSRNDFVNPICGSQLLPQKLLHTNFCRKITTLAGPLTVPFQRTCHIVTVPPSVGQSKDFSPRTYKRYRRPPETLSGRTAALSPHCIPTAALRHYRLVRTAAGRQHCGRIAGRTCISHQLSHVCKLANFALQRAVRHTVLIYRPHDFKRNGKPWRPTVVAYSVHCQHCP